ncbi:sensor histidine kinase [Dethiothermospora halolimnae]|uniref:sensor histidine kinase n=1 Tax=Dethiothermospora halolimnae TaxID=3114390 RepID=UPI003CCB7D90
MDKIEKYSEYLRVGALIAIFFDIISKYKLKSNLAIYLGLFFIILLNDNLRYRFFYKYKDRYYISLLISTIGAFMLAYFDRGYTQAYMFIIFYEIIVLPYEINKNLVILQMLLFMIYPIHPKILKGIITLEFWKGLYYNLADYIQYLIFIAFILISLLYLRFQITERRKSQKLNKELKEAYDKLEEYSKKVEELTISKERNRVSQEIHDSIGHNLTALIMHLEVAGKIIDKDKGKTKELIEKTENLARNSMNEVRKAVYALKENTNNHIINSLYDLKKNLTISDNIKVNYDIDEDIEMLSPDMKNIIYRSIQEGLTNGIKHGKATQFNITIEIDHNILKLIIEDNGLGCHNIKEGNGLKGMCKRIEILDGDINYKNIKDKGFIIDIKIPLRGEEDGKDKSYVSG